MAKRQIDPFKAKQKKQRIVAAVLGVVFLGVLAYEGPKTWARLHPSAPVASASTSTSTAAPPTGTPTLAAPTLQGGSPTPAASGTASPAASSGTTILQDGQLASFSRFASKDPFAQQISADNAAGSSPSSPSKGSGSSHGAGLSTPSAPAASGRAPTPGTAVVSVNGTLYTVSVGTDFPQASSTDPSVVPLFHLVSLGAHTAKISIVGGSYANGAAAVTLTENKPVTLMNTADGTRYKLILKPAGTSVPKASAPAPMTSTTVTVPPPSP